MEPLQLWLPRLQGRLALPEVRRDRDRAFRIWRGEQVVWIVPGLTETLRWQERDDGSDAIAINGDQWERLHVYHVSETGAVAGPHVDLIFPEKSINGLLDAWLNPRTGQVRLRQSPGIAQFFAPFAENDEVFYRPETIPLEPRSLLPISATDETARIAWSRWPPEAADPLPVSPEAESADRYRLDTSDGSRTGLEGRSSEESELNAMPTLIEWAEPFGELFPMLPGPDDLFAQAQMIEIAARSGSNLEQALGDARTASADWISEGRTTIFMAWLEPIIETEGDEAALFAAETRYNLIADELDQGLNSPEWRDVLSRSMPIRRAWGVTGLCWALLTDQLNSGRPFRHCERCGRLIHGRSNKRFCSREDNITCFRERRAADRSRERGRR